MTKDETMELLTGAVLVVLAYAIYKHVKEQKAGQGAAPQGFAVGERAPGTVGELAAQEQWTLDDILKGVTDYGMNMPIQIEG